MTDPDAMTEMKQTVQGSKKLYPGVHHEPAFADQNLHDLATEIASKLALSSDEVTSAVAIELKGKFRDQWHDASNLRAQLPEHLILKVNPTIQFLSLFIGLAASRSVGILGCFRSPPPVHDAHQVFFEIALFFCA